ncbi:MAG: hypothetical protein IT431_08770 [Phycisphaerales bacterium]|nr:hypothetical protein [Phycisphaerales bacterium]
MNTPNDSRSPSVTGWCYACFAYDIGLSVDLDKAGARLRDAGQRLKLPVQRRRGASWLGYEPPPLRVTLKPGPVAFGRYETDSTVECTVFNFGGVSIRYRVPIRATLDELPRLSDALYENWPLLEDSRKRVEELSAAFGGAITQPQIAPLVEDYAVFALERFEGAGSLDELLAQNGPALARILRAETGPLSEQQVRESLAERVSFSTSDAVLASWEGAVVLDPEPTDVLTVLEHVNVELVELRLLDNRLDALLDEAYAFMQRQSERSLWPRGRGSSGLRGIAAAQIDAAMLFESVNNAIKLVGDQHLARVYSLAAARVHLADWDGAILRKLDTAESIYQKLTQFETGRRMEVLEIVIVILIALSIVLTFVPGGGH